MLRKILRVLLLIRLGLQPIASFGQWVTISDTNFVNHLQVYFPSCMNGNQMDTTCNGILTATRLFCPNSLIANLDGVQYFKELDSLECHGNPLTTIPSLPDSLKYLSCGIGPLSSLPPLPNGLVYLYCALGNLSSLPTLPVTLKYLYCWNSHVTNLPPLPNLIVLDCFANPLGSLPPLPLTLLSLNCSNNSLTNLPTLPSGLVTLDCNANQLTSLPTLPFSLQNLSCQNNQLSNLPSLPALYNLIYLICNNNLLTSLPTLPNTLLGLVCNNNLLSCLPILPSSLGIGNFPFNISNNPISCLPNYINVMNGTGYLNYAICAEGDSIYNSHGCLSFKGVFGKTYSDTSNPCIWDTSDIPLRNIPTQLLDTNGNLYSTFYTLSNGIYNYILDTSTYKVAIDTTNKLYTSNCVTPYVDSIFTLTSIAPVAKNINFNISCKPQFDIGTKSANTSGRIFPGQPHRLTISAGDLSHWYNLNCADGVNGTVTISVTGNLTYDSIPTNAMSPSNITNNVFTYNISDYGLVNLNSFCIWFTTDTTAQSGETICVSIDVTPTIGDFDTTNNHYSFCYIVTNSYDPNSKEVYPETINPLYSDYFVYTIRFQNLGTAAAQNIRILDTLDSNLDPSTFEIINYSHHNISSLQNNVAAFRFTNIQLPDSTSNPNASVGFIQYRIKPLANLPFGSQIKNKAIIYFDFNSGIVTNTVTSNVTSTTSIENSNAYHSVNIYPNPSKGIYNLEILTSQNNSTALVEVFNIFSENISSTTTKNNECIVDLSIQPNGIYFLRISNADNSYTRKLIKQ